MEPLVSIGLCVRNGDEYLPGALNSLLGQTYKNLELIISDNASTDDTQKICEEYATKDNRIRYIRQKENIGSLGNYDFVRKETRGDYFMYASNDDLWHPRFIEKCLAKFGDYPDAIIAFPNFCTFDDSGRIMKYEPRKYFPFSKNLYGRLKEYILSRSQYGKSTMIYGLWKKSSPADQIMMNQCKGDLIYMFQTLIAGYFAPVDETLFFKRLPVQYGENNKRPSLHHLTSLPTNHKYETVDDWIKTMRKGNRIKEFLNSRLQSAKCFHLYNKNIFRSSALTVGEKLKLSWWNFYMYLKSFWYGYL